MGRRGYPPEFRREVLDLVDDRGLEPLPCLAELEDDLRQRRERAVTEGWLGEVEGIDLTLRLLADKRLQAQRLLKINHVVDIGLLSVR
ncbi:hypothetical protein [Thermoactinospora rubra]|uniref:hypothetical protein n=1 Tax=Thermoactinospora rubra TaxID=1088767 RepID=UPI001F0AB497|nr:hypothetical protein [Thermoactinospora rubra]